MTCTTCQPLVMTWSYCQTMADLITIWLEYCGDGEMYAEVWRHLQACWRCQENKRAIARWRRDDRRKDY